MPRKSKDELKNNNLEKKVIENSSKENKIKKVTKKTTTKTTTPKESKVKKSKVEKSISDKNSKAKSNRKKASSKNTVKARNSIKNQSNTFVEYYDLPYRYNETTIKILSQTPTMLFIYWDISDRDRNIFLKKYGDDFFSKTKPVLIIRNKTMNYTFEVEINDFANSWYLHVNDANCDYSVELGRRPIERNFSNDYVYVTTSNDIQMPNNHILFDKLGKSVFFRNIKNNFSEEIPITSMSFIKRLGKVYNIYELYKEIYKEEINIKELSSNDIKLNLSSSSSSTFM